MSQPHRVSRWFRPLAFVLFALQGSPSHAQWTQTHGPRGGLIRAFATAPDGAGGASLYSGQFRVWRTDDRGANWAHLGNGLTESNSLSLLAVPDGSGGNDIIVGTTNGIFRSSDDGASWSPAGSGVPANLSIYALTAGPNGAGGTNLYAGTYLGDAYRSTDGGGSWTAIHSGLPLGQAHVHAMTTTASGTVLAGTGNGIYRSTNFGASWTRVFTLYGLSFARNGATLYAGTSNGVYRSTNDGASWTPINTGLNYTWVYAMAAIPEGSSVTLFAGAGGVLRSTDGGASWAPASDGLTNTSVQVLITAPRADGGTDLYAGTSEGIFRTSDLGASWTNVSFVYSYPQGLDVTPSGAILAGTDADVFRSTDGGATWTDTQVNAPTLDFAINPHGVAGVSLFAGGATSGMFKSTDDGATWVAANNSLDDLEVNSVGAVPNGSGGTNVIAGTYSGIFVSTNDGGYWQHVEPNAMPLDWVVTPNGSGGHDVFGGGFGGVWRSTDGGMTWTPRGLGGEIPQAMAATGGGARLFAGGSPFGVHRSTDGGATWSPVHDGLTNLAITALLSPDGTNLFAGGAGGVYLTTDQGESWTPVGEGLTTGVFSLAVSADGSTLIAGSTGFGVWTRPIAEMITAPLGVDPAAPRGPSPLSVRVNPASGPVEFVVPRSEAADAIEVFDVGGRSVDVLSIPPGARSVAWHWGRVASRPGVYLARLRSRDHESVRFVVIR